MTEDHEPHRLGYARAEAESRYQDADRAQTHRARQAAEALFAPKRPVSKPIAKPSAPEPEHAADEGARKPRVLRALPEAPAREEPAQTSAPMPAIPEPPSRPAPPRAVPSSHRSRIRAWLRYGMTVPQVADIYGVAAGDIERVLQRA
jgi:hypothetical protein